MVVVACAVVAPDIRCVVNEVFQESAYELMVGTEAVRLRMCSIRRLFSKKVR